MYSLNVERTIDAPADVIWDVTADVERYAEYAPNLSKAEKTRDGPTPARRCIDTQGRSWNEACVLWEEGRRYSYLIDTSDYPYPFIQMKGTWGLGEADDGVIVYMHFDYTPSQPWPLGWLTHRMVKRSFQPIVDELMDNWEAEIELRLRNGHVVEEVQHA